MFDDQYFVLHWKEHLLFNAWTAAVRALVFENTQMKNVRVVILEIGAGRRVPATRLGNEGFLRELNHTKNKNYQNKIDMEQTEKKHSICTLIRINPEDILKSTTVNKVGHTLWFDEKNVIGIMCGGLLALKSIDNVLKESVKDSDKKTG